MLIKLASFYQTSTDYLLGLTDVKKPYRAAKAAMSDLLGGAKLPKMDVLKKRRRELADKKKALYAEYRKAQADMREAVAVKGSIDYLLGHSDGRNKAQER